MPLEMLSATSVNTQSVAAVNQTNNNIGTYGAGVGINWDERVYAPFVDATAYDSRGKWVLWSTKFISNAKIYRN